MYNQLTIWRGTLTAALLLLVAAVGCGRSGPPRAAIHGTVTAGGQPLAAGRVLFIPVHPTQGPAASVRIANGAYQLSAKDGPVVGSSRVLIEADLNLGFELDDEAAFAQRGGVPLPPNPVPPEYGTKSTQVVEVKAGEDNSYDVSIPQLQQVAGGSY